MLRGIRSDESYPNQMEQAIAGALASGKLGDLSTQSGVSTSAAGYLVARRVIQAFTVRNAPLSVVLACIRQERHGTVAYATASKVISRYLGLCL